ncbi:MAG: carbohydrate kinase family protein [Pseudomonadota bacterium]
MRALCVGSATIDVIIIVADRDIERVSFANATQAFLMLEEGRKIEARTITRHLGGGAVNAAVGMARQGVDAGVFGKIGRDRDGDEVIDGLRKQRVEPRFLLRTDVQPTGFAAMVSAHERNATIFTQRGANTLLRPPEIKPAMFEKCDLVYVAPLSNRSADCLATLIDQGKRAEAFVAVNPGIRQILSRTPLLIGALNRIDLLTINATEAAALAPALADLEGDEDEEALIAEWSDQDPPPLLARGLSHAGYDVGLATFFRRMRRKGARRVVVTDGGDGAWLCGGRTLVHMPTLKTEVMGTAGAGDAFASTLASRLADGEDEETALRAAAVNAAGAVSAPDTQSGLLTRAEIEIRAAEAADRLHIRRWRWAADA